MKLHEYQSKKILKEAGLPVPKGMNVNSEKEVPEVLQQLNITRGVVKAQAYTGGRGKAGGVKLFFSETEAVSFTEDMIGMTLVTHQTGPEGVKVHSVYIEDANETDKEFYLAILLDRAEVKPLVMISPDGGTDIEEVAEKTPDRIMRLHVDYNKEIPRSTSDKGAEFLGLNAAQAKQFADVLNKLYKVYCERDSMLLEINPLILTKQGDLSILDCKFDIDDNAIFRQEATGGDPRAEMTESEIAAKDRGMSYITLDGQIGCMVNGAGLAMATMDSIKYFGGEPANFLDVGGSASEEAVTEAFRIIASDENVKVILVNIFGGIMKCDTIANGIIAAVEKIGLKVPLVVRLEGTNADKGKALIEKSGLDIISVGNLAEGAQKSVALLHG